MRIAILTLRTRVDGVLLGVTLTYLFWGSLLLQCGDVETNPGPPPEPKATGKDTMRQTRLASSGAASSRPSLEKHGSRSDSVSTQAETEKEPTNAYIVNLLRSMKTDMDAQFSAVKQEVHTLREDYALVQEELRGVRQDVDRLHQQNQDLQSRNEDLTAMVEALDMKVDDLEGRSKRNNLIFYGLHRKENETPADCEDMLTDLFTDKLEFGRNVEFDRVHRLSSKSDSPVIARCCFYKQKVDVLKAKAKLKGTNIFVGEDFSAKVRDIRRRLTPHMKKARSEGKRATLVFNYLLVDGKRYTVNSEDRLVDLR